MSETVAAMVIVLGVLVSAYVNYLAWSWILGVRRRTRVRRLARPDRSPPEGELEQSTAGHGDGSRQSR